MTNEQRVLLIKSYIEGGGGMDGAYRTHAVKKCTYNVYLEYQKGQGHLAEMLYVEGNFIDIL